VQAEQGRPDVPGQQLPERGINRVVIRLVKPCDTLVPLGCREALITGDGCPVAVAHDQVMIVRRAVTVDEQTRVARADRRGVQPPHNSLENRPGSDIPADMPAQGSLAQAEIAVGDRHPTRGVLTGQEEWKTPVRVENIKSRVRIHRVSPAQAGPAWRRPC